LSGHPSNDWQCCETSSYLPPLKQLSNAMSVHWTSTILTYHPWGQFGMQCLNGLDLSEQISKWTCWICGVPVCQDPVENNKLLALV
jgi:hypothetical protein